MTMPPDVKAYNKQLIEQFRANGGPPEGRPVLLLTTLGARTGKQHTTPMMFVDQPDGTTVVIASNAGAPSHPDWFRNLVAHPQVTVEKGAERYRALAVVPEGADRDRIWAAIVADHPFFAEHQQKATRRTIPVVVLERAD